MRRAPLSEIALAMEKEAITILDPWPATRERADRTASERENYRIDQEMSPRLAALVKKIENGSAEFRAEPFQPPAEKQDD